MNRIGAAAWHRHLLPLTVWTVLCGLFFGTILLGRERLPAGDFTGQFHAFSLFQAREMAQGRLPFWSPGSYGGIPFAADTQSAVYYLPRWLMILCSLPWGTMPLYALEIEAILHIWLAGAFTYALAFSITDEPAAALLGAIGFALGGYLTSYPMMQLAILETITWLPLALLLLRCGVSRRRPVPWLAGAGLVLAISALAGHPQTLLHVSYVAAAYYVFLAVRARWSWRWILGLGLLIAAVAIGTSASALLPALHFTRYTIRHEVSYGFVADGLPLIDYVQVLVPGVLSLWSPQYVGLGTAVLVVVALWGRHKARQAEITFWGITALLAAWLALGDSGVLFELAYRVAPGFALFRRQERLLGVWSLSYALLAAQGLAIWLRADRRELEPLLRRTVFAVGCALALGGLVTAFTSTDPSWQGVWLRQWVVLAVVMVLLWAGRWRRQGAWALMLVLGVDLYVSSLGAMSRQPGAPQAFWPQPIWLDGLRSSAPGRLDPGSLLHANVGEIYSLETVHGISPLKPQVLDDMERALPTDRLWQLLNVTHVLAPEPVTEGPLTLLAPIDTSLVPDEPAQSLLYRFDAALPRAWMSYQPEAVPDAAAALQRLADPTFSPAKAVVFYGHVERLEEVQRLVAGQRAPEVRVSRVRPGALHIEVTTAQPGFLVVSEWHFAGWRATLNGVRAPLYPANYALQALWVPAGEHTVILRFWPIWEMMGLAMALFALAASLVLVWCWRPVVSLRQPAVQRQPAPVLQGPAWLEQMPWLWIGLAVMLVGFGLRTFRLGGQELRGDEAFSYLFAVRPFGQIMPALLLQGDPHSPLHYWLLHGWIQLAGRSEFALRYISILPSVLLLPLIYQLGRRLWGPRLGLLAAGLAAISQSQVWIAQDVRNQYTLAMIFVTVATLLLAKALDRSRWRIWALYAAACALGVYSHYYAVFALLAHGLCMLCIPRWRQRLRPWAMSVFAATLAFLPWLLAMWPGLRAAGQLSAPSRPSLAHYVTTVGRELAVGPAFPVSVGRWLFLLALFTCVYGAYRLGQERREWATLLILWLSATTLGIFLMLFARSTFNAFYIIVAAPAWWLLVAAGILALWERGARTTRILAVCCLVVILAGNGQSLRRGYFDRAAGRPGGYRSIAAKIGAEFRPGDVFVRDLPDPCYDYYLEHVPMLRAMQPARYGDSAEQVGQGLAMLARDHDRLWYASAEGISWDREGLAQHWLGYNTLLEQEAWHAGLILRSHRPLHSVDQVMAPLNERLEGRLRLAGVFITVNGVPADLSSSVVVPPGAAVKVTLLWESLAVISDSYTVFVHLMGEDGRLIAQHDGLPVFGTCPTWTWEPGARVLDRHDIGIPDNVALDKGSILVGLYHSETLERQFFPGGYDAITVANVQFASP